LRSRISLIGVVQISGSISVDWEVVVIDATEILVQRPKKTEEMV